MKSSYNVFTPLQQVFSAVVIFVLVGSMAQFANAGADKVDICHFPPGNPENVQFDNVAAASLGAHLAHGDFVIEDQADSDHCQELIDEAAETPGCTDETATNYDEEANKDDGSCVYPDPDPILGCIDDTATNYNPDATEDEDPSLCEYPNPEDPIIGCMDVEATNYNLLATEDEDPSLCEYSDSDLEKATIVATKIVCDAESYLPDWATPEGIPTIDGDTAADFLAGGDNAEHCAVAQWDFEWAQEHVSNPGDNVAHGGINWTAFSGQTEIEVGDDWEHVWVREVIDTDYIPFTGNTDSDPVSAELYCSTDSYHYDNYDRVDDIESGNTYHCIAFNVLKETDDDNGGGGGNDDDDLYLVYGYVWNDEDKDAIWDGVDAEESEEQELVEEEAEESLAGWTVKITNGDDTFETTTDEDGYYFFEVPEGTWTISEMVMEGWEQTAPNTNTYEVTVPEPESLSFLDVVIDFVIPTAYAQTVSSFGPFNFGNAVVVTTTPTPTGGGGGGGGGGQRISLSDGNGGSNSDDTPEPIILGEQVSAIPLGAPNAGAGGTSSDNAFLILLAILGVVISLMGIQLTRNAE